MSINLCAFADEACTSLEGQIKALKENNINLLEIRGVDGKNISELTTAEVYDVKNRLDNEGIAVWSIGSPIGKININEVNSRYFDLYYRMLETADILKVSNFRVFSFYGVEDEQKMLEYLNKFVIKAAEHDILLCHENEKDIYGDVLERCLFIHEKLPALKAVFDPANFIQCGVDVLPAWQKLASYTKYLHVKDALPNGTIVPAGHGIGGLKTIIDDFKQKGGVLTIEPHLHIFEGLKELEHEHNASEINEYTYPDGPTAFATAVKAAKNLLA